MNQTQAEVDSGGLGRRGSRLVFALLAMASACYLIYPVQDADLFWHLVIGRWIRAHGELPTEEHWNYFGLGHPFRAYSWLAEICFSAVEDRFGWSGLFALQTFLTLLLAGALVGLFLRLSRSLTMTLLLTAFLYFSLRPFVVLRPQVVTFLAFVGITAAAERIFEQKKDWK